MNLVIGLLTCSLGMLTLHLLSPDWWWVMAVPLLYGGLMARSGTQGFLVGCGGAALVWGAGSAIRLVLGGEIVARRVADMIGVGEPWILVLAATLIAAISAGLAALTGYHVRRISGTATEFRSSGKMGRRER